MDVLRFATAGGVDDGKSTLIGRLLLDSRSVPEDQLAAVRDASARGGRPGLDLAMLTDGLRAEREQGITIDVAYRYFATPRRKFIVADCPGHVEYTRNMATGVSTADAALVLVDASKGLQEQTRRHLLVAALMRVPRVIVCVNKMDAAGWSEPAFAASAGPALELARRLGLVQASAVPLSALRGDNVVERSARMPWYGGPSLLEALETAPPSRPPAGGPLRLPVQSAILSRGGGAESRAYAGYLAGGSVRPGEELLALPGGGRAVLESLELGGRPLLEAAAPLSVTLRLRGALDVGRGDVLTRPGEAPPVSREHQARLCWMSSSPLEPGRRYWLRHGAAETAAVVSEVLGRVDLEAMAEVAGRSVGVNEFARVRLKTARPLCADPYAVNRATGCFLLLDDAAGETVAGGMLL